jgi:hypothetical protein
MEYLKYKVYINETDYEEFVLTNTDFTLDLGIGKERFGPSDFSYQLSVKSNNLENIDIINNFIFNISSKIKNQSDIFKIEINIKRDDNKLNKNFIFYQDDFKDFSMYFSNTEVENMVVISFAILSMEQNYI